MSPTAEVEIMHVCGGVAAPWRQDNDTKANILSTVVKRVPSHMCEATDLTCSRVRKVTRSVN